VTEHGGDIFVKENSKGEGAKKMFDGEFCSLQALWATGVVRVPKPIKVLQRPSGGALLAMEFLTLGSCTQQAALGSQLAKLHLHNKSLQGTEGYVGRFGFDSETCCGFLPQGNLWREDWVDFYTEKLEEQIKRQQDSELKTLWIKLKPSVPKLFSGIEVFPSLLHGDLWGGNVGQVGSDPVMFDPASFYGHHEYDLGIAAMFGGFTSEFYSAYHKHIPKAPGFDRRNELYQLFHNLNHWNHFGGGYRSHSLSLMSSLLKSIKS